MRLEVLEARGIWSANFPVIVAAGFVMLAVLEQRIGLSGFFLASLVRLTSSNGKGSLSKTSDWNRLRSSASNSLFRHCVGQQRWANAAQDMYSSGASAECVSTAQTLEASKPALWKCWKSLADPGSTNCS
jgi:hypothetical protein